MILFIDTSSEEIKLGLLGKTSNHWKKWFSENYKDDLQVRIQNFLKQFKVNWNDLEKVAVVVGPGHFSRLRAGVATANTLGFALNIPIGGIKAGIEVTYNKLRLLKPAKLVKPYYDKAPNITRPK